MNFAYFAISLRRGCKFPNIHFKMNIKFLYIKMNKNKQGQLVALALLLIFNKNLHLILDNIMLSDYFVLTGKLYS